MAGLERLQSSEKTIQNIIEGQTLIAELMDATPTSSFEEAEWAETE
eukprot:CAMPEP_0206401832 /NCGR_PEP_ID=MMETSP0294-20121207/26543_1 /ASSEMBLY_ACC=CAM_ASM_000327 /TAXON_ID=39354 /ORGANISM="Heterosigma akashiwo, Strain CCMP2393" /LENGTH=45 /DNA_ID= /DNA_START= /DNA_END= /DNA_ORIENTATION=